MNSEKKTHKKIPSHDLNERNCYEMNGQEYLNKKKRTT